MNYQHLLTKLDSLGLNTLNLKDLILYLQDNGTAASRFSDLLINLDLYSSEPHLDLYTLEILLAQIKSTFIKYKKAKASSRSPVRHVIESRTSASRPAPISELTPNPDLGQVLQALNSIKTDLDHMRRNPVPSRPTSLDREVSEPVESPLDPVFVDPLIGVQDLEFKTNNIEVVENKTSSIGNKLDKLRKLKKGE